MSFEINPVLAGTFDRPDYPSAVTNISASANSAPTAATVAIDPTTAAAPSSAPASETTQVDPRRYTQFDRTITDAGTSKFTFSDFLDLINPLQHIPIVSSIYRAATGEQINPVARVAGDILFGGIFGVASAALGGVGAVADAGLEEQTGKDSGGLVVAALFGDDEVAPSDTKLADAGKTTPPVDATAAAAVAAAPVAPVTPATQTFELAESAMPPPAAAALQVSDDPPPLIQTPGPESETANFSTPVTPIDMSAPSAASSPTIAAPANAPVAAPTVAAATGAQFASVTPSLPAPPSPPQNKVTPSASTAAVANSPSGSIPLLAGANKAFPLDQNKKQPYGGVISMPKTQAEDMALALSASAPGMRMGHMIYTDPHVTGQNKLPPMLSSSAAAKASSGPVIAPPPTIAPPAANPSIPVSSLSPGSLSPAAYIANAQAAPGVTPGNMQSQLPQQMIQNLMMQALSQYQSSSALSPNGASRSVNLTN